MVVALLLSMAPFSALAQNHVATRTPVAFTSTVVEVIDEGEESVDEAGIFHIRGAMNLEEVTGDISGSLVVTYNVDFQPAGECTEESCPGFFSFWGHVEITGEDGGWEGTYIQVGSDVPGEEFFADSLVLRGTGANAHMSIVAQTVEESEESITFEGMKSTLAKPLTGLNTSVRLCADPEDFSFAGGFLSTGAIEGQGAASGEFLIAGTEWTHSYAAAGTLTLTDAHGSITIAFSGSAQDNYTPAFAASHVWGHFVIVDGTGDYAEFYGSGRLVATAGEPNPLCESSFGVNAQLIGETHFN